MDIGKRIKELRLSNQLTQDELAVRADLTAAFISMVESNKSSISIEYLIKVLAVMGESLSGFFSPDNVKKYVFEKKDRVEIPDQGVDQYELLNPGSTSMIIQPSRLVIAQNQKYGPIQPHSGEEIGYILRGRVAVWLGKRKEKVKAGCCFQYKADQEHTIENIGKSIAEILLITYPPQF